MLIKFIRLYLKHITSNKTIYVLLLVIFFLGIIAGNISVRKLIEEQQNELSKHIQEFMNFFVIEMVDNMELFKVSLYREIRMLLLIIVLGFSIIGIPLIFFSIFIRGFTLGFAFSSILVSLGKDGIFTVASIIIFKELLLVVVFISVAVAAVMFSMELLECFIGKKFSFYNRRNLLKAKKVVAYNEKTDKVKIKIARYLSFVGMQLFVLLIAISIETVFLPVFIKI